MRKTFDPPAWTTLMAVGLLVAACGTGPNQKGAGGAATAEMEPEAGQSAALEPGRWRGSLSCPGGPLTFGLDFVEEEDGALRAVLVNGTERRPGGLVNSTPEGVEFHLPPYQSRVVATLESGGHALVGRWERDRGEGMTPTLAFAAVDDDTPLKIPPLSDAAMAAVTGRWAVNFAGDDALAVGIFEVTRSGRATGTFLTTLGDYRYLAGYSDGQSLHLSCFDGAHAFLFEARIQEDGSLGGDFWSRDSYHDTWTAVKDSSATLPDDFALTEWVGGVPLEEVRFPDAAGQERSLADDEFAAPARLLVIFGTWCPNCNDLTEYLVELDARYPELGIVGLAFEMGDDAEGHRKAVTEYAAHHGATYPILLGGTSDKAAASEAFPLVDKVRAYPTTVFMDGEGNVTAVHTGFSGPATGEAHGRLKERFQWEIESLLGQAASKD